MKKTWLYKDGPVPWGSDRPARIKETGGPPSIEYVAEDPLWGNSVGTKPNQLSPFPAIQRQFKTRVPNIHKNTTYL